MKLEAIATDIYTIEEVLKEVKDKKTRARLGQMPFELKTREPHPRSMKAGKLLRSRCVAPLACLLNISR